MIKVLLIEDDAEITALPTNFLARYAMEVIAYENTPGALDSFGIEAYDIVLLDLTLPEVDGLEVCRRIREKSDVPIIISSALPP